MNQAKRNIVVSWWNQESLESRLNIFDVQKKPNKISKRYPHIVYLNDIQNLKRKEGFIFLSCLDEFDDILKYINYLSPEFFYEDIKPDIDLYEFDRLNRSKFKNFEYVIIISIDFYDFLRPKTIPYSPFIFYDEPTFKKNSDIIFTLYEKYLNEKNQKFSNIKLKNISKLKNYLKQTKKTYYTTKEIKEALKVNEKWVQRYMKDMNTIYKNIGYNHHKNMWYVIK